MQPVAAPGASHQGHRRGRPQQRRRLIWLASVVAAVALLAGACSSDSSESGASGENGADGAITRSAIDSSFGELDQIVETAMQETGIPGIAVAVVYDDEVVYEEGYGVKNITTGDPVDAETVFQIASMSKPVSSTIMAGLVGEEVIAWDDPIAEHSSQFELSDPWVSDHVTFADLFAHRSGLPGGPAGNDLESVRFDRTTILERLRDVPLNPFRITYSYSNFGMTLAGEVAAEAAGATWEEVAEDVLFGPAGMASTSMRNSDFLARSNRADLHAHIDGEWVAEFDRQPDAQAPAGGVSSNVADMARWVRLQLAGGELDGVRIIDEDALAQTHLPQILTRPAQTPGAHSDFYGLGWVLRTDSTGAVNWDHSGAFSLGASTTVKIIPSEGFGMVVLSNGAPIGVPEAIIDSYVSYLRSGDAETAANLELWQGRMSGLYGEPELDLSNPPANPTPARPDSAYIGAYANDYVGAVEVIESAGGLAIVEGPERMTFPLEHWDGDTFVYVHDPELPDFPTTVVFQVGPDGTATALTISAFDGAGLGTLQRIQT